MPQSWDYAVRPLTYAWRLNLGPVAKSQKGRIQDLLPHPSDTAWSWKSIAWVYYFTTRDHFFFTPIPWDSVLSGTWPEQGPPVMPLISEAPAFLWAQLRLWTSALTFVANDWAVPVPLLATRALSLDGSSGAGAIRALGQTDCLQPSVESPPTCTITDLILRDGNHHPPQLSLFMIKATMFTTEREM